MADDVTVVDLGLEHCAAAMLGLGATSPKWIEWGTGTTATARAQVDLVTPGAEARTEGTDSLVASTEAGAETDIYQTVGTIVEAAGPQAITEVGTWTNLTAGLMFLRAVFAAINVETGNSIEFTIQTKFAPA